VAATRLQNEKNRGFFHAFGGHVGFICMHQIFEFKNDHSTEKYKNSPQQVLASS